MRRELIDERQGSDKHANCKDERMFPVALQEFPIRCHASERDDKENERCDTKGDIRVEAETENKSAHEK